MRETAYAKEAAAFLRGYGNQLHEALVQLTLANWNFKQRSTKANQAKYLAAEVACRAAASDAAAYASLCKLLQDERFQTLDRQLRRALKVAQQYYDENIARPGDDPHFQSLREELHARTTELHRIVTTTSDTAALPGQIPAGYDKTFAELVRELVVDRNRLARMREFDNFYHMSMAEAEMDFQQMRDMLAALKTALDALAPRLSRIAEKGPNPLAIDSLAQRVTDVPAMLLQTAELLGVPSSVIEAILATSDLYPRRYKDGLNRVYPIDSPIDVRALLNIRQYPEKLTSFDLQDLLHEIIGHAVDFRSILADLQPLLRRQDDFTTEAIAMLVSELVFEPRWLRRKFGIKSAEMRSLQPELWRLQLDLAVLNLRFYIAIAEFEIEMYVDPTQDLDAAYTEARAWAWNMPAAKVNLAPGAWIVDVPHYISLPCYCHNYVLGTALANQVRQTLRKRFGSCVSRRVGPFISKHRSTGLLYTPDEQIVRITGLPFSADALIGELNQLATALEDEIARTATSH